MNHKTVLITGASTGIGEACARYLSERGVIVFAGVRSDEAMLRLRSYSQKIHPVELDVTRPESIQFALGEIQGKLTEGGVAGLDGLVNNAGIVVGGPIELLPLDALQLQWDVNVKGVVATTQAFIPLLRERQGRIVNIGSIAGLSSIPYASAYSMSKYALEAMTDALRIELRPWGIRAAIIEPGAIATPLWNKSLNLAESLVDQVPAQSMALYKDAMEKVRAHSQESAHRGIHADAVAEAVWHALMSDTPKTRYPVGGDAQIRRIFRWLPDPWKDWLIVRKLGL